MVGLLQQAVQNLGLHEAGINPNIIGAHSLRIGKAMPLKLTGQRNTTIMKLGCWSSLTLRQTYQFSDRGLHGSPDPFAAQGHQNLASAVTHEL
eukprot:558178-Ditylum_brightwellii.AAC.1